MEINNLIVHSNSHRVMPQVNGEYEAIEERLKMYVNIVQFLQVPRANNCQANQLVKMASSKEFDQIDQTRVEIQMKPSIEEMSILPIQSTNDQTTLTTDYSRNENLPSNPQEARKIRRRARGGTAMHIRVAWFGSLHLFQAQNQNECLLIKV